MNFKFQIADEICGIWSTEKGLRWLTPQGALFFLATWSWEDEEFGLYGIYHEALHDLEELARSFAENSRDIFNNPRRWPKLADLSEDFPGWGLVHYRSPSRIRLFRDPLGRLPIFYSRDKDSIQWGTRPAVLPSFEREIRRSRLKEFILRQDGDGAEDFWQGIYRLRPGEEVSLSSRGQENKTFWWPPPINPAPDHIDTVQRTGDLLCQAFSKSIDRFGDPTISQSGGVDSNLLVALARECGANEVHTISMVEPTTKYFDERETIELVHDHLEIKGHFYDIGGPQRWDELDIHHPIHDFGPAFMAEAAYIRPYLDFCREILSDAGRPLILTSGHGADQLFYCPRQVYRLAKLATGDLQVSDLSMKEKLKVKLGQIGVSQVPIIGQSPARPPWIEGQPRGLEIRWANTFKLERWFSERAAFFQSWSWEYSMRLMESYRRMSSVLRWAPFLTPRLAISAMQLHPLQLSNNRYRKYVLRRLFEDRVPPEVSEKPKRGIFDEIIWPNISRIFRETKVNSRECGNLGVNRVLLEQEFRKMSETVQLAPIHGHALWRHDSAINWKVFFFSKA